MNKMDDDVVESGLITKILGEMKHQFNSIKEEIKEEAVSEDEDEGKQLIEEILKIESEVKESEQQDASVDQPRIVMCFRKPKENDDGGRKTRKSKPSLGVINLKRSTRRRSKDCNESVLQSAIARKEKSYNETSKPQRLTRQLKPTQKILDNIAAAKKKQTKSGKIANAKKSNPPNKHQDTVRRSERFNSHNNDSDENDSIYNLQDNPSPASESLSSSTTNLDSNSASAQLIASRLCVCAQATNYYVMADDDDEIYCSAIDSIGKKLIGCNNLVKHKELSMLRPSTRVPYMNLCHLHRQRLLKHNCCATCGIFCTQGEFSQCKNKHQYHRNCQITVGDIECCPHCGETTPKYNVEINMETQKTPIFLKTRTCESVDCNIESDIERHRLTPELSELDTLHLEEVERDDTESKYNIQDLFECIKEGNYAEAALILGTKSVDLTAQVHFDDDDCGTLLHYAAKNGLISVLHMLRIADLDLDIQDDEHNTALMVAVANYQNDALSYLTKAGADVTMKGMDGMNALHLASKCGNLEACQLLLLAASHIKDYVDSIDDGGWTPLIWACEHSQLDLVRFLLSEGADHQIQDVEGNLALHWAAFSGSSRILEILMNFGDEIDVVNLQGDTPLHIAARQDNYNCVITLLARGACTETINKADETPIDACVEGCRSYDALLLNIQLRALIKSAP